MIGEEIVSWKEAKSRGLIKYFNGKPCPKGHIGLRYVSVAKCVDCITERAKRRYLKKATEICARNKKYYENNKAKILIVCKAWADKNREKVRGIKRDWEKRNPQKVALAKRNRRARGRNAEGFHTTEHIQDLFKRQKGKCANCNTSVHPPRGRKWEDDAYHVDHITPLSKGGSNWPWNLQLLCGICNDKKGTKDPIVFAQENGRLL